MNSKWEHPAFDEDWHRRRRRHMRRATKPAPVTQALLVSTIFVFVFQLIIGLPDPMRNTPFAEFFYLLFMLRADLFFQEHFLWQPLTHMFLHVGPLHILFNMLCLFFVGPFLERRIGPLNYLAVYFLGGFLGGILQVLFSATTPLLGASGGVFAVILGFCALEPNRRILLLLFLIVPVPLRCRTLAIGLLGTSAIMQVLSFFPGFGAISDLGHMAHLGGGLTGWVYVMLLRQKNPGIAPKRRFTDPREFDPVVESRRISRENASEERHRPERVEPQPRPRTRGDGGFFPRPAQGISPRNRTPHSGRSADEEETERILDKVAREGLHSLTRKERDWLDQSTG